jgi:hypothetical protein
MNEDSIWKFSPTKTEVAAAIPSERVHALTTSTELGSPRKSLEPDARPYRKRGYFVSSSRSVIDRLKAAAIEFALITMLIAGFILPALFHLDLLDMLRW